MEEKKREREEREQQHEIRRDCWCGPDLICEDCLALGPCIHGVDRAVIVVHRRGA
jgi:hypothetical protein